MTETIIVRVPQSVQTLRIPFPIGKRDLSHKMCCFHSEQVAFQSRIFRVGCCNNILRVSPRVYAFFMRTTAFCLQDCPASRFSSILFILFIEFPRPQSIRALFFRPFRRMTNRRSTPFVFYTFNGALLIVLRQAAACGFFFFLGRPRSLHCCRA